MDDRTGTPVPDVAYENTADEVWGQQALSLHQGRQLLVETFDTAGVVSARVWGPCPRCKHELNVQMTLSVVLPDMRNGRSLWAALTGRDVPATPGIPETVDVGCGCERRHSSAPEHVSGCGVSFRLPTAAPSTAAGPDECPS